MDSWDMPVPEESGQLVPPSRRPPTAVGLAMMPAPLPPRRRSARQRWNRNHPLIRTAEWVAIGSAVAWVAPSTPVRIAGLVFGALGFGAGATWLAVRYVIGPMGRASSRRQRRD